MYQIVIGLCLAIFHIIPNICNQLIEQMKYQWLVESVTHQPFNELVNGVEVSKINFPLSAKLLYTMLLNYPL